MKLLITRKCDSSSHYLGFRPRHVIFMTIQTFDLADADPFFKEEVVSEEGGHHLQNCFQCSSCTLTCPIADVGMELNPRMIIRKTLLGLRKEVLESRGIWQCVGCFECTDRCPQNVRFTEIIEALRRIAVKSSKHKDASKKITLSKEGKLKHSFDKRFTGSVKRWGRTWEPGYISRYLLYGRGFPFGALVGFQYISMILGMLTKLKIEFIPPINFTIRKEVQEIFKKAEQYTK